MASATPPHDSDAGDASRLNFAYTTWEAAPELHRRIARMAQEGRTPQEIVLSKFGLFKGDDRRVNERLVRKVLTHHPICVWIQESLAEVMAEKQYVERTIMEAMTEGRYLSIKLVADKLKKGENVTAKEALAYAQFFADRHPDGEYVKRSHTKVDQTVNHVVTGDILVQIKENAARARVTCADDAHLINVDATSVLAEEEGALP
jgi:hypothetical protein